ncbi:tyrosine-type recombinase/integrase, partial [Massilicoli timonensis]|uniref:tyrosine-type recombinase/integrase n=1 Tax=Massilicoli timonensis TaxID=2015901 RepID=UPI003AB06424
VYEMWLPIAARKKSNIALNGYKAGFKNASMIHDIPIQNLKTAHYQLVLDKCQLSSSSKIKLRSLLIAINKFAIQEDIIEKNYAEFTVPVTYVKSKMHKPFTNDEIKTLWDNIDLPYVDTILIMIYSGYRINELLNLICGVNVDLDQNIFIGGFKTKAGKNRIVPIHHKILPFVQARYKNGSPLIRTSSNSGMKYLNYRNNYFDRIMIKLKMDHLPHDCRHTFATLLNNADANNTTVTKLIGHKSFEMTEKVYIHKNIEQLKETIEKINV